MVDSLNPLVKKAHSCQNHATSTHVAAIGESLLQIYRNAEYWWQMRKNLREVFAQEGEFLQSILLVGALRGGEV